MNIAIEDDSRASGLLPEGIATEESREMGPSRKRKDWVRNQTANAYKRPISSLKALSWRQLKFVQLVISGQSYASAYRIAYEKSRMRPPDAANNGQRVAKRPLVKEQLDELRSRAESNQLLSLNQRFRLLAEIAQDPFANAGDRIRAVEVYTKIAGDRVVEPTSANLVRNSDASPAIRRLTVREKIAALVALKKQRDTCFMPAANAKESLSPASGQQT